MSPVLSFFRSKSRQYMLVLLVIMATACCAVYGVVQMKRVAPNVEFTSLTGNKIALQDLRGKMVLINFWATSCTFCIQEMPQMVDTYRQFKGRGLEIVAIAMSYDPPNLVLDYTQSRQLPFPVVLDVQANMAQAFGGVEAAPTTLLIDQDGRIIARFQGELKFDALHQLLDRKLGKLPVADLAVTGGKA